MNTTRCLCPCEGGPGPGAPFTIPLPHSLRKTVHGHLMDSPFPPGAAGGAPGLGVGEGKGI